MPPFIQDAALRRTPGSHTELPVLADDAEISQAPRIAVITKERVHLIKEDPVGVDGSMELQGEFLIMRVATRLQDPLSGEYLGSELHPIGKAKTWGNSAVITEARHEISNGDLLWPLPPVSPRWPTHGRCCAAKPLEAFVVSTAGGGVHVAQNQMIGINKGARDGLTEGLELALFAVHQDERTSLPRESGRMMIHRVFERVSYGIITHSIEPLRVGDKARVPEGGK